MSRRVTLPGASELFRAEPTAPLPPPKSKVRHDEKITVYISREELLALESARLRLRGEYDVSVDRGRIVRAAIAKALADLEESGDQSDLVTRLRDS